MGYLNANPTSWKPLEILTDLFPLASAQNGIQILPKGYAVIVLFLFLSRLANTHHETNLVDLTKRIELNAILVLVLREAGRSNLFSSLVGHYGESQWLNFLTAMQLTVSSKALNQGAQQEAAFLTNHKSFMSFSVPIE